MLIWCLYVASVNRINWKKHKQKEQREYCQKDPSTPALYHYLCSQSCLLTSWPTRGWCSPQRRLCDGICLVCSCISITNPQWHSASQTSSPKVSERSRASALDDESCVSMVLGADLVAVATAVVHCMHNRRIIYYLVFDYADPIIPLN